MVGVAATILSNPKLEYKTPSDVASELLILADKNRISGLDARTVGLNRTVDAVAQVSI